MIDDVNSLKKLNLLNSFLDNYGQKAQTIPNNGELIYACVNGNCPSHIKRKDKFCVNIVKESAHCWVCGIKFGSLKQVVQKFGREFIQQWNSLSKYKIQEKVEEDEIQYFDSVFYRTTPIKNLKEDHSARLYLKSRYINLEKAERFNITYVKSMSINNKFIKDFICVPSHSELGINYLFFRSINSSFKINTRAKKSKIIFNDLLINWNKKIFLTDGVFDALRLFDFNEQAIPILGSYVSKNSEIFKKIVLLKPDVIIALDPDAMLSQLEILDLFYRWNVNVYSMELHNNDIAASSNDEIESALNNIKQFNSSYKSLKMLEVC